MADTDFLAAADKATLADTDALLIVDALGVPYNVPANAVLRKDSAGLVVGGLKLGAGTFSAGVAQTYTSASYGALLTAGTGSVNDLTLASADGQLIFCNPHSTRDILVGVSGSKFASNVDNGVALGGASNRFSTVYAGTGTINTSDAREKQQIGLFPNDWLDAWADVDWCRFKLNDAVEAKGDDARWHLGLIAQQVRDAFDATGIDARAIGLLCFDEWDATSAVAEITEQRDEDGQIVQHAQPAIPAQSAGERWGLRYEECLAIEAAWQRREIAQLAARLVALETI